LRSTRTCIGFVIVLLLGTPASGASAQSCPNESLRAGASKRLPDCRAYEMVSPLDKNGALINPLSMGGSGAPGATIGVAPDGDAVAFPASGAVFADNESSPFGSSQYVSTRSDSGGWSTRGINPPMRPQSINGMDAPVYLLSEDLTQAVVASNALLAPDAERLDGVRRILYRQDNTARPLAHTLLSRPEDPVAPGRNFYLAGATEDFSHITFLSQYQLTSDGPTGTSAQLYEWAHGEVRYVPFSPAGGLFGTSAATLPIPGGRSVHTPSPLGFFPGDHFISDDGRRIYFTADGLYVREDGTQTRLVSGSEVDGADPNVPTTMVRNESTGSSQGFQFAKADDGSVAFFTSGSQLTDDSSATVTGHSLYRWDANAQAGARLTDVTATTPPLAGGAGVRGVAAATEDATHVYFVADGALTPDTPATPAPDNRHPRLYLWRQGEGLRFVAPLAFESGVFNDPAIVSKNRRTGPTQAYRDARVSPDGRWLLFASHAQLTAYDNAGHKALYLYDAATEAISCVSCSPIAPSSSADAHLFDLSGRTTTGTLIPYHLPRNLSADGTRVVFEADGRLVPEDGNGQKDVYLWEEGGLHLVSSGQSGAPSRLIGASADLGDIFFVTDDPLVSGDLDDHFDVYDARVAGGIPSQHPRPSSPCEGEDCQGAMSGAPLLPGVASAFGSHGDRRLRPRASFSFARLTRAQRAKLARGRRVMVRVRVNRSGRVSLRARAKLGGRMRTVASAAKAARRAGTVRLSLKLSRSGRRALARQERLRIVLSLRFAGVREARTSSVILRQASPSGERRTR
jgi:WD40-like Beta Propeller Repeat